MLVTVGVGDMKISNDPDVVIITHALGSCIGVTVYDPEVRVGGMLHYMLPDSRIDPVKAKKSPYMFADTGVPILFKACYKLGAVKQRMIVKVMGGSQIMDDAGIFNIGQRNYQILKRLFIKNNIQIEAESIGGTVNRTVRLYIATGDVELKMSGQNYRLL